jgi:hypothetical protein
MRLKSPHVESLSSAQTKPDRDGVSLGRTPSDLLGYLVGVCLFGTATAVGWQCHRSADPIFHWIVHGLLVLVELAKLALGASRI